MLWGQSQKEKKVKGKEKEKLFLIKGSQNLAQLS